MDQDVGLDKAEGGGEPRRVHYLHVVKGSHWPRRPRRQLWTDGTPNGRSSTSHLGEWVCSNSRITIIVVVVIVAAVVLLAAFI